MFDQAMSLKFGVIESQLLDTIGEPPQGQAALRLPIERPNRGVVTRIRDGDGRDWAIGQSVRGTWCRDRLYPYDSCPPGSLHEVRPTRWPIPPDNNGRDVEVGMVCEQCGWHVMVRNQMAQDDSYGVKVILPQGAKK